MLCIQSYSTDPYFNIAAEEHFLKNYTDDIFYLYRNQPSVIIGKHQNAIAELDLNFVEENGIHVVRRLSGGGAVYHDMGNINFTFIRNGADGKLVDFIGFTKPIIDALKKLGINAVLGGHNSLLVGGKKVSGNAEHIFKNRVMHHGTLLFSTDLKILSRILYVDQNRYEDKAVKSVRANVTNLRDYIPNKSIVEFLDFLWSFIKETQLDAHYYNLSPKDIDAIKNLVQTKYCTWEWNYGYSPNYQFTRVVNDLEFGELILKVKVERGIIVKFDLNGERVSLIQKVAISELFVGNYHKPNTINLSNIDPIFDELLLDRVIKMAF